LVRPTINSRKHIGQFSTTAVAGLAINKVLLADSRQSPNTALADQVQVGAIIKAVYLEFWILSDDNAISSTTLNLQKKPSGASNMTFNDSILLQNYNGKNDVFYITQGLTGDNGTNPTPFIRGWFKIPKGKQRMAFGEQLVLNISAITNGISFCGFFLYKEYY